MTLLFIGIGIAAFALVMKVFPWGFFWDCAKWALLFCLGLYIGSVVLVFLGSLAFFKLGNMLFGG
jgi:hypothetical protein